MVSQLQRALSEFYLALLDQREQTLCFSLEINIYGFFDHGLAEHFQIVIVAQEISQLLEFRAER